MRTPAGETPPCSVCGQPLDWKHGPCGGTPTRGAPDVRLAATPASDDLRNGLQILDGARVGVSLMFPDTSELALDLAAVARLLRAALTKLEAK